MDGPLSFQTILIELVCVSCNYLSNILGSLYNETQNILSWPLKNFIVSYLVLSFSYLILQ